MPGHSDDVRSWADSVAKLENRTMPKIPQKSIFGRRYCCKALHGRYEDRWSFLYEMMWSPHVAVRETQQRSLKFLFVTPKGLFQHYPPHNRTSSECPGMSQRCHDRTRVLQQITASFCST